MTRGWGDPYSAQRSDAKMAAANYCSINLVSATKELHQEKLSKVSYRVIIFSNCTDLWAIKILKKACDLFAQYIAVHWDQVNRAQNTDHTAKICERFVHSMIIMIFIKHGFFSDADWLIFAKFCWFLLLILLSFANFCCFWLIFAAFR